MLAGLQRRTRSPQTTKSVSLPAPQGGVNRVDGLAAMPPQDAIFLYNMIPSEYGTKVREGYAAWVTDVGDGGVRTIIPFKGVGTSKLFGVAEDGIYDITNTGTSPAAEISFGTVDSMSGYGTWVNFVNDNGAYFCLYCDESNGYYVYEEVGDTWTKIAAGGGAGEIDGVDPDDLAFVTIFKERVWFVERGTGNAWYLDPGAIYGTATKFAFGNKFSHGGSLVGLYSWTVDGGEGVDDYLVAIGSGGDVLVYKGTDPATATDWFLQGSWYIGPTPAGRRVTGAFSGELYLLSTYGIIPMSKLMSGTLVQLQEVQLSRKISPLVNSAMQNQRAELGWEIRLVPSKNFLIVSTPKRTGYTYSQFVYSLNTPAWTLFRDLPYLTGETWEGDFYFSDPDGNVYRHTGTQDSVDLNGENGVAINWSGMMSFQGFGDDGSYKRVHFIRPVFLADASPDFVVEARYDYNLIEVFGAGASVNTQGSLWDDALWDVGLWGGEFNVVDPVRGGSGLGRVVAVGFEGNSSFDTVLVKIDLMIDAGGML